MLGCFLILLAEVALSAKQILNFASDFLSRASVSSRLLKSSVPFLTINSKTLFASRSLFTLLSFTTNVSSDFKKCIEVDNPFKYSCCCLSR